MGDMLLPKGFKKTELGHFPEDWDIHSCSALSERIMVGIVIRPSQYYVKFGIPALRSANIRENGINNSDLVFISEKSNALLAKSQTRQGDVLTVRTGYPGTSAVVHSSHAGCNCIDILITRPSRKIYPEYLAIWVNSPFGKDQVLKNQGGLAQQHFNVGDMKNLIVALPKLAEQQAIATALSDIDALIAGLDQLIAKKRALKQAAMQQLLTGQKRLPGFEDEWIQLLLGDVAHIKTGSKNNEDKVEDGAYPLFVRSQFVERIDSYSYNCEAILVPGEGGIGSIFHYVNGKFDCHQRVYKISEFDVRVFGKFIFYWMKYRFHLHATKNSVKATVDSLRLPTFLEFEFPCPTIREQQAIVDVLFNMDSELTALEQRRDKTRLLKQGMMQELLTGRIRLVPPTAAPAATQAESRTKSPAAG